MAECGRPAGDYGCIHVKRYMNKRAGDIAGVMLEYCEEIVDLHPNSGHFRSVERANISVVVRLLCSMAFNTVISPVLAHARDEMSPLDSTRVRRACDYAVDVHKRVTDQRHYRSKRRRDCTA